MTYGRQQSGARANTTGVDWAPPDPVRGPESDSKRRDITWLLNAPENPNLATELTKEELGRIGQEVVRTYELDCRDRADWDRLSEFALKLAKQVKEAKTFPWVGCANVKHPLITVASIQFAARAYPEICKMGQIVKCRITGGEKRQTPPPPQPGLPGLSGPARSAPLAGPVPGGPMAGPLPGPTSPMPGGPMPGPAAPGPEPANVPGAVGPMPRPSLKRERAERIETHMNWQLTEEMPEWDQDTDRLLHILPVIGQLYRKTYFDTAEGRNISELVLPSDCVVNKKARTIEKARRITHTQWFYINDIRERVNKGLWLEPDFLQPSPGESGEDPDAATEFLEQHCYMDLDGDGYKEPYIATVQRSTAKTVRVVARWQPEGVEATRRGRLRVAAIKPDQYFTHYGFIPNPDGSINYLGFGQLLASINETTNSVLNQLLDSGTLYNAGGGFFARGVRMRGGQVTTAPGIWHMIDAPGMNLKDNMVGMPVKEPSAVLFQLLGFLVQSGQEISSVQDILAGDAKLAANMPVGTAMALVEQGLKVFTAIYKRVYRSLTDEFKKLYRLNAYYLDPVFTFFLSGQEEPKQVEQRDYSLTDTMLVVPIADPNLSSDMQRMLRSQALKDLSGRPGLNEPEITRRLVRAIDPENAHEVLMTDDQIAGKAPVAWKPPPPPQMIVAQAKAQRLTQQAKEAEVRLQMDMMKFQLEVQELQESISNKKADTILKLATAKDKVDSDSMERLKLESDQLTKELEGKMALLKQAAAQAFKGPGQGGPGPGGPRPAAGGPEPVGPGALNG